MQIVSELLCATASTESVSEGMDITDSSIAHAVVHSKYIGCSYTGSNHQDEICAHICTYKRQGQS